MGIERVNNALIPTSLSSRRLPCASYGTSTAACSTTASSSCGRADRRPVASSVTWRSFCLEATDRTRTSPVHQLARQLSVTAGLSILDTMNFISTTCPHLHRRVRLHGRGAPLLGHQGQALRAAELHGAHPQALGRRQSQQTEIAIVADFMLKQQAPEQDPVPSKHRPVHRKIQLDTERDNYMTAEEAKGIRPRRRDHLPSRRHARRKEERINSHEPPSTTILRPH